MEDTQQQYIYEAKLAEQAERYDGEKRLHARLATRQRVF